MATSSLVGNHNFLAKHVYFKGTVKLNFRNIFLRRISFIVHYKIHHVVIFNLNPSEIKEKRVVAGLHRLGIRFSGCGTNFLSCEIKLSGKDTFGAP